MQVTLVVMEASRRLGFAFRVLIDVVSNVFFRLLYFNTRKGLPPVTNKILLLSATGKLSQVNPTCFYKTSKEGSQSKPISYLNRIGSSDSPTGDHE